MGRHLRGRDDDRSVVRQGRELAVGLVSGTDPVTHLAQDAARELPTTIKRSCENKNRE